MHTLLVVLSVCVEFCVILDALYTSQETVCEDRLSEMTRNVCFKPYSSQLTVHWLFIQPTWPVLLLWSANCPFCGVVLFSLLLSPMLHTKT